jgi:putative serine protease PepD
MYPLGRESFTRVRRPSVLLQLRPLARAAYLFVVLALLAGCAAACSAGPDGSAGRGERPSPMPSAIATVAVPSSVEDLEQTLQKVIQLTERSVVEVQAANGQGHSIGSGDVIRADGYIVTNDHVVRGFTRFQVVLSTGQILPASLVGEAPSDDLAVLKVAASSLQPVLFGNSANVRVGELVLALGSPLDLQQSVTLGIVSALNRTASEAPSGPAGTLTGLIQTSAPINPGNSGGALVNLHGELIGIPTLGAADPTTGVAAAGIGFAIPANRVRLVTDQFLS